jgi:hypothetical protein
MNDRILKAFLDTQYREGMALAAASDIVELLPLSGPPVQRYLARFHCRGLVRTAKGGIEEADQFDVGIWMPDNYLRSAQPEQVVNILRPLSTWHPNAGGPFICLGRLSAGTSLVDILFQIYEVLSYQKWSAHDGLNHEACEWARNNQRRFPVDRRPLKWKGGRP